MRLLSFFDKETGEYVPVGVFEDIKKMETVKEKYLGFQWEDHEVPVNVIDKETIDMYKN